MVRAAKFSLPFCVAAALRFGELGLARFTDETVADAETLVDIRQYGFEKIPRDVAPAHPGNRTKVHVTDWNGDGRVDLLVGDVRWLYYSLERLWSDCPVIPLDLAA